MNVKYKIEGLDCAHCASKIQTTLENNDDFNNVQVSFTTKMVTLDTKNTNNTHQVIQNIVSSIEPGASVMLLENGHKRNYKLIGLNCAHCATKIETALQQLPYLTDVNLSFSNSILYVTSSLDYIDEIQSVVDRIEDGVKVTTVNNKNIKLFDIKEHYLMLIGVFVFVVAMFLPKVSSYTLAIYIASYIALGYKVLFKAFKSFKTKDIFSENLLMVIATTGAFIIGEYNEAIAVMLFFSIGELFQSYAVNKSRDAISNLVDLKSEYAHVVKNGKIIKTEVEKVRIGEIVVVKVGQKVPLDGFVTNGITSLDTSMLTGESLPSEVAINDQVLAGTINLTNVIEMQVTHEYHDTSVAKIIDLMENASMKKAKVQKFIEKFSKIYTPVVVLLAILLAIIPPFVLQLGDYQEWLYRSLTFLVVSCPCALIISVPLGSYAGLGKASKLGVLIKGGTYLELLNQIDTIVFDKTGTLTKGTFEVLEISDESLYEIVAHSEYYSNHPLAKSIVEQYHGYIDTNRISNFIEKPGKGIEVMVDGTIYYLGNIQYIKSVHPSVKTVNRDGTIIYIACSNEYLGYISVGDRIKESSKQAINTLKKQGVKSTIMLTGDNQSVAKKISEKLGLDKYFSDLLPQDKVSKVDELIDQGHIVAMVGDGINDAPVLSRSHVAIAMGNKGSDIAIEAADVVLMSDDLTDLCKGIDVAKKTAKIIYQNICFSLIIKMGILVLTTFGYGNLMLGVFADVGVTLLAIFNTMRILR